MPADLEKAIRELSQRMRLFRIKQEENAAMADFTERDALILSLLDSRGKMTVSQITAAEADASTSTISTAITKLWRA